MKLERLTDEEKLEAMTKFLRQLEKELLAEHDITEHGGPNEAMQFSTMLQPLLKRMDAWDRVHKEDCDCGECCVDCTEVGYLDDDGRCEECAQSRAEYAADCIYESMKYGD